MILDSQNRIIGMTIYPRPPVRGAWNRFWRWLGDEIVLSAYHRDPEFFERAHREPYVFTAVIRAKRREL